MTTLLVFGFPYATSANAAAEDILLQEPDLATEPDAVAIVSRDTEGAFHVTTNHTLGEGGYRFFWHLIITALIFLPASGALGEQALRAFSRRLETLGFDPSFQDRVREMLAPETSALFLLAARPVPPDALTALGKFGAKLLAASLVPDLEGRIAVALHETGEFAAGPTSAVGTHPGTPGPRSARVLPSSRPSPDGDFSSGADSSSGADEGGRDRRPTTPNG